MRRDGKSAVPPTKPEYMKDEKSVNSSYIKAYKATPFDTISIALALRCKERYNQKIQVQMLVMTDSIDGRIEYSLPTKQDLRDFGLSSHLFLMRNVIESDSVVCDMKRKTMP